MVTNWLKSLLSDAPEAAAPQPRRTQAGPFGLSLGRAVGIDVDAYRLIEGDLSDKVPPGSLVVSGHGVVNLDASGILHRYYDDKDNVLQVVCVGGVDAASVREVMLLQPWDSVVPQTPGEWATWEGPGGRLGRRTYDADGVLFERHWGDPASEWVPLVEFVEDVTVDEGPPRRVHQKTMAYKRPLPNGVVENLVIIVERDLASGDRGSISFMLGYGVAPADVQPV